MDSLTCLSILTNCTLGINNPQVSTPFGIVEGHFDQTVEGRTFVAFEGIPYARPPVGKYRFREPQPIKPWIGTWKANTLHKCLQYNHRTNPSEDLVVGDEDCLYLNIYTPHTTRNVVNLLLDVIIFIHGGAFMFNSAGTYGPKILLNQDVVYVTFNYRLGPLGFLSTEDAVVPGNNGIKDQILAMRWIKENIRHFGGNPDSITLTGMSAGGASVQLHYISPQSVGLFNRGISQSGTMLSPWVLVENSAEKAKKLATINGCPTTTSREMIDCLRFRPAYQIVDSVKYFLPWLYNPFSPFGIVIDKWSPEPVLPDHPYILLKNKQIRDLPWISSNVGSEGLYPAADFITDAKYLQQINDCWNVLIPHILDFNNTIDPLKLDKVSQKIKDFYFRNKHVSKETFSILVQMIGDRLFTADSEKATRLQAASTTSPVYYYYFTYRGANSKSEVRSHSNENFGASHGDDTVYILSSNVDTQTMPEDKEMSDNLVNMWISFASTGKPQFGNVKWPIVSKRTSDPLQYLKINSAKDVEILSADFLGNRDFWDGLGFQENKNLFIIRDEL